MSYTKYSVTKEGQTAKALRKKAGAYLKSLREDRGLTQTDIAKRVGFEYYTFVSQIETGLARVPPEKVAAFDRMDQVAEMNNAVTKLGGRYVVTDGAGRVKSCASRMSLCLGQWLFGGTKDPEWFFNNTRHIGTAADGSTTSGGPQHGTVSS